VEKNDLITINVLILELATMIVAIALAFTAESLASLKIITFYVLTEFIIITVVVIWFWWLYVMLRLKYPPLSDTFPIYDVLILVSISLFPFVYKLGGLTYLSILLSMMMLFWSTLLFQIIKEHKGNMVKEEITIIRTEAKLRLVVVVLSAITALVTFFSNLYGTILFSLVIFIIILSAYIHRISRKYIK